MNWHPDDDVPYNPEPDDEREGVHDRDLTGVPLAYDGAVVMQRPDGDFECEHGRNITGSPTATARGCLLNCPEGETR